MEHGVRHVCMSCARGQLWRDEGSLRQTTLVCRAGSAEQTLAAKDAADERTFQGGDRHPGPRFSASAHGKSERGHIILQSPTFFAYFAWMWKLNKRRYEDTGEETGEDTDLPMFPGQYT